jgi:alpha-amylase
MTMRNKNVRAMADIVINHRMGSTQGCGGLYNRYDGLPAWDERAVTRCTGGLVRLQYLNACII